ncbi:MAG: hypothetical protein OHK0046_46000 [Anaerolineae bacterium]
MAVYREYDLIITTAADGTGSASTQPISGTIERITVDYAADVAATADLTIVIDDTIDVPVLTLTNTITDGVYTPVQAVHAAADGSVISGLYNKIVVARKPIRASVAQGGDSKTVSIKLLLSEDVGHILL